MSVQSDAAKAHLEKLLEAAYPQTCEWAQILHGERDWKAEYRFALPRRWAFDYAVLALKCAIELDGGTFKSNTGHNSGVGLRGWREKNNTAMSLGWRVWHYAPEEVIKAGRKIWNPLGIEEKCPRWSDAKPCLMNRY